MTILQEAIIWKYGNIADMVGDEIKIWRHKSLPKPNQIELAALKNEYTQFRAASLYKDKRASEYPSIGDQLDAIWKGGEDMEAMRQQILAVKAKYPKP